MEGEIVGKTEIGAFEGAGEGNDKSTEGGIDGELFEGGAEGVRCRLGADDNAEDGPREGISDRTKVSVGFVDGAVLLGGIDGSCIWRIGANEGREEGACTCVGSADGFSLRPVGLEDGAIEGPSVLVGNIEGNWDSDGGKVDGVEDGA